MLILGIETSCDETGVALYDTRDGLLAEALHSQADLHALYGGVVPELASRDHVRRLLPLTASVLRDAGRRAARRGERGDRHRTRAGQAGGGHPSPRRPPALAPPRRAPARIPLRRA